MFVTLTSYSSFYCLDEDEKDCSRVGLGIFYELNDGRLGASRAGAGSYAEGTIEDTGYGEFCAWLPYCYGSLLLLLSIVFSLLLFFDVVPLLVVCNYVFYSIASLTFVCCANCLSTDDEDGEEEEEDGCSE